jgi:two-component system response regulator YesN
MSYSSLAKKMKLLEDESFIKCVNRVRTENAKKLLAITEKSITEISFECGFSSTSYFIKIFRELTGMTPKIYRSLVNK